LLSAAVLQVLLDTEGIDAYDQVRLSNAAGYAGMPVHVPATGQSKAAAGTAATATTASTALAAAFQG
jgi:hypothetical protein